MLLSSCSNNSIFYNYSRISSKEFIKSNCSNIKLEYPSKIVDYFNMIVGRMGGSEVLYSLNSTLLENRQVLKRDVGVVFKFTNPVIEIKLYKSDKITSEVNSEIYFWHLQVKQKTNKSTLFLLVLHCKNITTGKVF